MAETKKDKVFDVAKPGKSAPATSAKPVIVTNRPVLKDPMVVEEDNNPAITGEAPDVATPPSTPAVSPSNTRLKIQPLNHDETADKKDDGPTNTLTTAEEKPQAATPAESSEGGVPTKSSEDTDIADTDEPPATPKANAEATELAARKEAERQEQLDKVAESRKYYLPINQVEKRRNRQYTIAGVLLIILLAVVWADIALDAGIVTIPGVKAPTHLFK